MASGSPGHRSEGGAVGSCYLENSSQPRRGTPKPLSPAEKSQDDASEAALLLGLHHDGMWLRETPPASPCTSTVTQECAMDEGSSTGEQQMCWLSQLPAWVTFNKCFQFILSQLFSKPPVSPLRDTWTFIHGKVLPVSQAVLVFLNSSWLEKAAPTMCGVTNRGDNNN